MSVLRKKHDLPECLSGFEQINRYWDKQHDTFAAKILPGEYYVTTNNEAIVTVLGSCVSACIRDKKFGIGGMNHFMLPQQRGHSDHVITGDMARYGNYAMEMLINDILKNGGMRKNLEVKVIGGGKIIKNMEQIDIGVLNIEFALEYLHVENIPIVAEDTGDIFPRKVMYYPTTGKVKVKKLRSMHNDTVYKRERSYSNKIKVAPIQGDVELF